MKVKKPTKKQRIVEMHMAGASTAEIAQTILPDQTPAVASASISRALKDNNVQNWVADAFDKSKNRVLLHDLIDQYFEELSATKPVYSKGEYMEDIPDYPTRQKARDSLIKLMQAHTPALPDPTPPTALPPAASEQPVTVDSAGQKAILQAIEKGDISAIERIVFRQAS